MAVMAVEARYAHCFWIINIATNTSGGVAESYASQETHTGSATRVLIRDAERRPVSSKDTAR